MNTPERENDQTVVPPGGGTVEDNGHPDQSIWGESSLHQTRGAPCCSFPCAAGRCRRRHGRGPPVSSFRTGDGRAAGLTLGGVVLTVNGDQGLVERQLAGGELACLICPEFSGQLIYG